MKVGQVSGLNFKSSEYVQYSNVPNELQTNENLLTQLAKDNKVTLKITKSNESTYLPHNNIYTVLAKRENKKPPRIFMGTSVLLTKKTDSAETVINQINKTVFDAILKVQKALAANIENTKTQSSFGKRVLEFFKNLTVFKK